MAWGRAYILSILDGKNWAKLQFSTYWLWRCL